MPWRKKTLRPYRAGDSASACNSEAASSEAAGSSIADVSNLFGNSDMSVDWNFDVLATDQHAAPDSQSIPCVLNKAADEPISKQQFDSFLGHAFLSVAQASDIQMPWEKGIFKQIFGDDQPQQSLNMTWFPRLNDLEDTPDSTVQELAAAAFHRYEVDDPVFARAIACISDSDFGSQQSKLRFSACNKWLSILMVCLHASDVGRNIAALGPIDSHHAEAMEILEAVIGVRSYHTAICRANAVLKFLRETFAETPDVTMPFTEEKVWRHFHRLKISGGATSAASMLSALRYAKYVMGFECLDTILCSKRLKGFSDIMFASKRKLQQAQILTVQQVRALHYVLEKPGADKFDRAAAGFLLTALYGRCRASDLSFLDSIKHDHDCKDGFVELFTTVHKTGRSAAKKATLLPILCPAFGVTGTNWAALALEVFKEAGLKFNGLVHGPLLRPPSHEGPYLCCRSVTSNEIGKLLRGLVGVAVEVDDRNAPHLSSHSLKATCLSWAARYGMAWPDRAILGRHQSHTNETVAIYSRDLAVGPVSRLAGVIKEISKGAFCPDAERSQYFQFPPAPPCGESVEMAPKVSNEEPMDGPINADACKSEAADLVGSPAEVIDIVSESSSSDSESGDSCLSSEDSFEGEPATKRPRVREVQADGRQTSWVAHKKSGLLHFCWMEPSGGSPDRRMTACGRTVTQNFVDMDEKTDGNAICIICQKRRD